MVVGIVIGYASGIVALITAFALLFHWHRKDTGEIIHNQNLKIRRLEQQVRDINKTIDEVYEITGKDIEDLQEKIN